jgi:hypothetical protein
MQTTSGFSFFPNTIMAPESFEALPEIEPAPAVLFQRRPGELFRTLIESAWHVVCWTDVEGIPTAAASRIDTRFYQHEE